MPAKPPELPIKDASADRLGALPTGTVTFLFTDIEGSTRLLRSDPGAYPNLLELHNAILSDAFGQGVGFGSAGDALFYAFADPAAAVAAAAHGQRQLAANPWPDSRPMVRMGISTGRAEIAGGTYAGVELHRVARICAAAHGGQILLGATSAALVGDGSFALRDLGMYQLKDFDAPERLFQLCGDGLLSDFPPPRTRLGRVVSLPRQSTRLIGRDHDLEMVQPLVLTRRLVTVTGPGGSGKTRLGIGVGWNLAPRFRGPVAFVSLAPLARADRVPDVALAALGRSEAGGGLAEVVEILRDEHALLVLDNAEHLGDLPPVVCSLLDGCPQLHLLITSRSPLGLADEQIYPVEPLAEDAAVELLVERARARRPAFNADEETTRDLRRVARGVACLPLGLELAAARLRGVSAGGLAERLDRQLDLLRDERSDLADRQQTMRAAVEWSYRLLSPIDASVFEAMSVFAGPARLEVISHIASLDELDTLDALTRLVDASLVVFTDASRCYGMLEPIRQYAAEQLGARATEVEDRLIDWYRLEAGDSMRLPAEVVELRRDTDNLFRALDYSLEQRAWTRWLDIVSPIVHLLTRDLSGFELITRAASTIPQSDLSVRDRSRLAIVETISGDQFSVKPWLRNVELARACQDPELEYLSLLGLTNSHLAENQVEDAKATLELAQQRPSSTPVHRHYAYTLAAAIADIDAGPGDQAGEAIRRVVADAKDLGDPEMLSLRLTDYAYTLLGWGKPAAAIEALAEARELLETVQVATHDLYNLAVTAAIIHLMLDDPTLGAREIHEALSLSPDIPTKGRRIPIPLLCAAAAALLADLGDDRGAAALAAFAERDIEEHADFTDQEVHAHLRPHIRSAQERLDASDLSLAKAAGTQMNDHEAVVYATDQIGLALREH